MGGIRCLARLSPFYPLQYWIEQKKSSKAPAQADLFVIAGTYTDLTISDCLSRDLEEINQTYISDSQTQIGHPQQPAIMAQEADGGHLRGTSSVKWARGRSATRTRRRSVLFHKQSTRLARTVHERQGGTVVVGNLTELRNGLDYGSKANQRLPQWIYDEFVRTIGYEAGRFGMTVERVGKVCTSRACPSCGNRHKPHGRGPICECGFEGQRDLIGAANIRKKYLGQDAPRQPSVSSLQVAGKTTSPTGVRYRPRVV